MYHYNPAIKECKSKIGIMYILRRLRETQFLFSSSTPDTELLPLNIFTSLSLSINIPSILMRFIYILLLFCTHFFEHL